MTLTNPSQPHPEVHFTDSEFVRDIVAGMSNGAMMAYRLASELSDRIAAIAPVGGPMGTSECHPARPVSVPHFQGDADE